MNCSKCGNEFEMSRQARRYRIKHNIPMDICIECNKVNRKNPRENISEERKKEWYRKISEARKKEYASMSKEDKEKRFKKLIDVGKEYRDNMTDDDKRRIAARLSLTMSAYWKNLSDEDRAIRAKQVSDRWNSLSDEEKKARNKHLSRIMKEKWDNLPQEEKDLYSKRSRERWESLSDEEKQRKIEILSSASREFRANLSDEEKERISKILSEKMIKHYQNITDEERDRINGILSEKAKKRWAALPKELREIWIENAQKGLQKYWDNLPFEKWLEHCLKTAEGMAKRDAAKSMPTEIHMSNDLNIINMNYQYQWNNKTISDEFYLYYNKRDNPYHVWDFKIHTLDGDILVDIDGSVHSIPMGKCRTYNHLDIGELIQYRNSKRKYQTDGLPAYAIEAYNDKIEPDTSVLNLETGERMSYTNFISLLQWMNTPEKERKETSKMILNS